MNQKISAHGYRQHLFDEAPAALGVVLPYHDGDDKDALVARAEKIRDELARQSAPPADMVRKGHRAPKTKS